MNKRYMFFIAVILLHQAMRAMEFNISKDSTLFRQSEILQGMEALSPSQSEMINIPEGIKQLWRDLKVTQQTIDTLSYLYDPNTNEQEAELNIIRQPLENLITLINLNEFLALENIQTKDPSIPKKNTFIKEVFKTELRKRINIKRPSVLLPLVNLNEPMSRRLIQHILSQKQTETLMQLCSSERISLDPVFNYFDPGVEHEKPIQQRLLGTILLLYIIKKYQETSSPVPLNEQEKDIIFDQYLPQELKSCLKPWITVETKSIFSGFFSSVSNHYTNFSNYISPTYNSIRQKISDYKNHLLFGAVSAVGIAALYKYLSKK
jgi:hypothetical protein